MTNKPPIQTGSQFLVYQTEDGKLKIDVRFEGETVWLAQQQMAELFQTTNQNVSLHIRNTFSEGELREDSVVKESLTTQQNRLLVNTISPTKSFGDDSLFCKSLKLQLTSKLCHSRGFNRESGLIP